MKNPQKTVKDLEYWFNLAIGIMKYIPVAIVDYDTGKVQFQKKEFESLKRFNIFFDILKGDVVFQVLLEHYRFSLDEPRIVDRAELLESFKEYVKQNEKRLGILHNDWKISDWAIPHKIMQRQILENYPPNE